MVSKGKAIFQVCVALFGAGLMLAVPAVAARATTHRSTSRDTVLGSPGSVKRVAFSGTYKGSATLVVINNGTSGSASVHNAYGTGSASIIGAGTFKQIGSASAPSFANQAGKYCSKFGGEAVLTGSKGTITLKVSGPAEVCSSTATGAATAQVEKGEAEVVAATGAAKGATGTVKFTGKMVTNKAETSGSFTLSLTGTI